MKKVFIILSIILILIIISFVQKDAIVNGIRAIYPQQEVKVVKSPKNIGILVIVIGRYSVFWDGFYKTCEKYFLPGHNKQYFVFTDNMKLKYHNKKNVHLIYKKKRPWPYSTLLRYDFFMSQKDILKEMDYLYFFNINVLFKKEIRGNEVFPDEKHDGLMVCWHPNRGYESNPRSTAYIPQGVGRIYAAGGFNGGTSEAFLKLSEVCSKNIRKDLSNNIFLKWNDESYLNQYIVDKNPLVVSISYLYPTKADWINNENYEKNMKIELLNKGYYGGYDWLSGEMDIKNTLFNKLWYKILAKFARTQEAKNKYNHIIERLYAGQI